MPRLRTVTPQSKQGTGEAVASSTSSAVDERGRVPVPLSRTKNLLFAVFMKLMMCASVYVQTPEIELAPFSALVFKGHITRIGNAIQMR